MGAVDIPQEVEVCKAFQVLMLAQERWKKDRHLLNLCVDVKLILSCSVLTFFDPLEC
jgi:hypothetical protein